MNERRRSRRRQLPFVRSGVLEVEGRDHIVSVSDIGPEGAFLSTRLGLELGQRLVLKMILPRSSRPIPLPCQIVWRSESGEGRQGGLAVRFRSLNAGVIRCLEEFAAEGALPARSRKEDAGFEYRLVDAAGLGEDELNRLGSEGWQLGGPIDAPPSRKLAFFRRL